MSKIEIHEYKPTWAEIILGLIFAIAVVGIFMYLFVKDTPHTAEIEIKPNEWVNFRTSEPVDSLIVVSVNGDYKECRVIDSSSFKIKNLQVTDKLTVKKGQTAYAILYWRQ